LIAATKSGPYRATIDICGSSTSWQNLIPKLWNTASVNQNVHGKQEKGASADITNA
jgi:hypothetical protein